MFSFQGPFTFTIGDTSKYGLYMGGGTVTEVKTMETVNFVSSFFFLSEDESSNWYFRNRLRNP